MNQDNIIGPGKERKRIKIYDNINDYLKDQEEKEIKEVEQISKPIPNYIYVPSLKLHISEKTYQEYNSLEETEIKLMYKNIKVPTIIEFIEFLKYLKSDEGKTKVKNADQILDDIYGIKNPRREEWFSAKFILTGEGFFMYSDHFIENQIITKNEELIEPSLGNRPTSSGGLDLDSWLEEHTKEGLPKPECKVGSLNYYEPTYPSYAAIIANNEEVALSFNRLGLNKPITVRYVKSGNLK